MKNNRPDIKIPYSLFEKRLEVLAAAILVLCGIFIAGTYPNLPGTIPIHFNLAGKADGFRTKAHLITLYAIMGGVYLLLSFVSRLPRWYNYPGAITPENAPTQYRLGRLLVHTIKVESLALLAFALWSIIATAQERTSPAVLMAGLIFFMLLIFLTTILGLVKLKQQR